MPKVSRHAVLISPARVVQAVAALLSEDTSAIVTLKSSGLDSPKELEGKRYASYGARYSSDTCEVALDALSSHSNANMGHCLPLLFIRAWKLVAFLMTNGGHLSAPSIPRRPRGVPGRPHVLHHLLLCRYEGRIVQRLIENSGGVGSFKEVAMPAREIWDAVLKVCTLCYASSAA